MGVALATGLAFGVAPWREVVEAQLQVGTSGVRNVAGLLAQGVWNEFPLLAGAAAAVWLWIRPDGVAPAQGRPSAALLRTLLAAAAAGALLALSVFKRDSYINVLVVAEPPLLVLAVCGAVWGLERRPGWRPARSAWRRCSSSNPCRCCSAPVIPGQPVRPGAQSGLRWTAGPGAVDAMLAAARRCPARLAYGGSSYLAFLSGRRMPGKQPDLFILATARVDAPFAARAARDHPRCPSG